MLFLASLLSRTSQWVRWGITRALTKVGSSYFHFFLSYPRWTSPGVSFSYFHILFRPLFLQDINGICTTGTRICRCMSEYFIFMKRFTEIRNALLLSKCLKQRLWESTKYQLKQLVGVGLVTAKVIKCLYLWNMLAHIGICLVNKIKVLFSLVISKFSHLLLSDEDHFLHFPC